MSNNNRISSSKKALVECRVEHCRLFLVKQNYKDHIINKHPNEDPRDLRTYGEPRADSFFRTWAKPSLPGPPARLSVQTATDAAGATPEVTNNDNVEHMDVEGHKPPEIVMDVVRNEPNGDQNTSIENIDKKLSELIENITVVPIDLSSCSNKEEECLKKIQFIKQNLKIKEIVESLDTAMKDFKSLSFPTDNLENAIETVADDTILKCCRTIQEITDKFGEFEYRPEEGVMICSICGEKFKYSVYLRQDFGKIKIDQKFSNLKMNLKCHLKTKKHVAELGRKANSDKVALKEALRNDVVAERIGTLCHYLISKGRPDSDLPDLISLLVSMGVDLGDINHSQVFVAKFLKSLAEVHRRRIQTYLSTRLEATGAKPPVNVIADKGTHHHITRQAIGTVTLVPGSKKGLIQALFIAMPKCPRGTGEYMSGNITTSLATCIEPSQYTGCSVDGAYINCHVGDFLNRHYGVQGVTTWDEMHLAGLVDTAMRNPDATHSAKFKWLNDMTLIISKANKFINFGMEFDHFCKVVEEMIEKGYDLEMRLPKFFSTTRFANWIYIIYNDFRTNLPALLNTLKQVMADRGRGDADQKKKVDNAMEIHRSINNMKFALSLSVNCDVYKVYGCLVNILQVVNQLPFTKLDKFREILDLYQEMSETVNIEDCPCSIFRPDMKDGDYNVKEEEWGEDWKGVAKQVCCWPIYHHDIGTLKTERRYKTIQMGQLVPDASISRTRAGIQQHQNNLLLNLEDIVKTVEKRALDVVEYLKTGLKERVFKAEDIKIIENIRVLVDLENLQEKVSNSGAVHTSVINFNKFFDAAKKLNPTLEEECDEQEIKLQYREFLRRLEEFAREQDIRRKEVSLDVENNKRKIVKEQPIFDQGNKSLEILDKFLDPRNELFKDIEIILRVLARAAVCKSVESVVESWISVMEGHDTAVRNLDPNRLEDEMIVSINGPNVAHCQSIVKEAMSHYWGQSKKKDRCGHFVRRSGNVKSWMVSKAVDGLRKAPSKLPFML